MNKIKENPLLIVCMTVYNAEPYLERSLNSILSQKCNFDFEIVIGEDCSLDNSRAILEAIKKESKRKITIYYAEKNQGARTNTLITLKKCLNSNYIALMDSDDYWTDDYKLQKQVDFLEQNTQYAACFHNSTLVDNSENVLAEKYVYTDKLIFNHFDLFALEANYQTAALVFCTDSLTFPSWFLKDGKISTINDWEIDLVLGASKPFYFIDETMAAIRVHSDSMFGSKTNIEQMEMKLKTCNFLLKENIFDGKFNRNLKKRIGHLAFQIGNFYRTNIDFRFFNYLFLYIRMGLLAHNFRFFNNLFYMLLPEFRKFIARK